MNLEKLSEIDLLTRPLLWDLNPLYRLTTESNSSFNKIYNVLIELAEANTRLMSDTHYDIVNEI